MNNTDFKKLIDRHGRNKLDSYSTLLLTGSAIVIDQNRSSVLRNYEHSLHELIHPFSRNFIESEVTQAVDFINSTTEMIKSRIGAASILGSCAFREGRSGIPAQDPALLQLLEGFEVGQGNAIMKAYIENYYLSKRFSVK